MATLLSTCTEPLTFSVASQKYWVHSISKRKKLRKEKEVSRVTQLVRVYGLWSRPQEGARRVTSDSWARKERARKG